MTANAPEGNGPHQLKEPRCVYVDANETVYICDTENHRIQRWEKGQSTGTTVAGGSAGSSLNQLNKPLGLTFDKNGLMYVADTENNRVLRYTLNSTLGSIVAGQGGSGSNDDQLKLPTSVVVDSNLNLYIADRDNNRIMCYPSGANRGFPVLRGSVNLPYGLALRSDPPNQFFVTTLGTKRLELWTTNGTTLTALLGQSATDFSEPRTVITDPYGNAFVADMTHRRIQMFSNDSWLSVTVVGDSLGSTPNLIETSGIAFDSNLNFYMTSKTPPGVYKFWRL